MASFHSISTTHSGAAQSIDKKVGTYLLLTFSFTWIMLIGAIKLGLGEEYLNIGIAGPALASLFLSRSGRPSTRTTSGSRWLWCAVLVVPCWIVLCLHYQWRNSATLSFHLNLFLLIPAFFPAWILSGFFSPDGAIRHFVGRLVHRPTPWSLIAIILIPAIFGLPSLLASLFHLPLIHPSERQPVGVAAADALMFFLFNLLFVGTLEEPGWRGFLLDRLQSRFSPLIASLLVWFPWAVWHAPLDYYRPVRFSFVQYILLRVVFLIPLTVILTWIYNRSMRSIQAPVLFHSMMNTFPFVVPYFQPAGVLIIALAVYAIFADRMWTYRGSQ